MTGNEPSSIIVYDGDCPFCRAQIERIRRRDTGNLFEYLPRQTPGIEQRFPALAEAEFNSGMRLIDAAGHIFVGADAVYQFARKLHPWRWFAWVYRLPGFHGLAKIAYAWVASRRQSLKQTCTDDTCQTP